MIRVIVRTSSIPKVGRLKHKAKGSDLWVTKPPRYTGRPIMVPILNARKPRLRETTWGSKKLANFLFLIGAKGPSPKSSGTPLSEPRLSSSLYVFFHPESPLLGPRMGCFSSSCRPMVDAGDGDVGDGGRRGVADGCCPRMASRKYARQEVT